MDIYADGISVGTGAGAEVPPMTLLATPGPPSVVRAETAERPALISMLITGRLRPDAGAVQVDGRADIDELRKRSALVDTPSVAEPAAGTTVGTVVAEELAFAARPASRSAVRAVLAEHGLAGREKLRFRALPTVDRIRLLSELALLRREVAAIVVTSPERHGGSPSDWYGVLAGIAERGVTVVIVTDAVTAAILALFGAVDAAADPSPATSTPAPPTPVPESPEQEVTA